MEPEISVVVPLRNESANVLPLTERIFAALEKVAGGVELILVDDASSDDTWQKILKRETDFSRASRHSAFSKSRPKRRSLDGFQGESRETFSRRSMAIFKMTPLTCHAC